MVIELNAPAAARGEVARRMKAAFDALEYVDSGWWYVDFKHPAFGREPRDRVAERVPGPVLAATEEPPADADVVIVAVGFEDPYTGDVHLGNNFTVSGVAETRRNPPDEDAGDGPSDRLPALALFDEAGRLHGLVGTIHATRETTFETAGVWPELVRAIAEWAQTAAQEVASARR